MAPPKPHSWNRLARNPWLTIGWTLLATALLAMGLPRLETDNSPSTFFRDGENTRRYFDFKDAFGDDDLLRWVLRSHDVLSSESFALLNELRQKSEKVPGVLETLGPTSAAGQAGEPAALDHALGFLDRQRTTATLGLFLDSNVPTGPLLDQLAAVAEQALSDEASNPSSNGNDGSSVQIELVGQRDLNQALDQASLEIGQLFLPLLVAVATGLLALALGSIQQVLTALAYVGLVMAGLFGLMGWLGVSLNLVLSLLPPLLFVIATATAVHVLSAYRRASSAPDLQTAAPSPAEAARRTLEEKGWALLWAGVTTFVGFTSLGLSNLRPVSQLGLFSGIGIFLLTMLAFSFLPSLLSLLSTSPSAQSSTLARFDSLAARLGSNGARFAVRHRRGVFFFAAISVLVAAAGLPKLQSETNGLRYLDPLHPVRAKMERLEATGIETASFEVWLRPSQSSELNAPEVAQMLPVLQAVQESLEKEPMVLTSVSLDDLLREAQRVQPFLAGVSSETQLGLITTTPEGRRAIQRFMAQGGYRVHAGTATLGADTLMPVYARAVHAAQDALLQAGVTQFEAVVTGMYPVLLESQLGLLSTLRFSLLITIGAIALVFRLLLQSTRLAVLALVPNLWPVLVVLGAMGWMGVALDTGTVMVASIVLGLAVDDTLHTLNHFLRTADTLGSSLAVVQALEKTAPAYILTGIVLAGGFGVCAFSDFAPIARFGTASAAAVLCAVVCDLLLVPALLSTMPSKSLLHKTARS